jgi:hypothetical protein
MGNLSRQEVLVVLEELYLKDERIPDQIFRDNPLLGILPKSTEGGGEYRHVHMRHVRPQGRSVSFTTAQANRQGTKRVAFHVPWRNNYQIAAVDGDVIDDAQGNKTILIDHIKREMDGAIDNMRDDLAMAVFRNHGGARGRLSAVGNDSGTNDLLTLVNPEDIAHFEIGMRIQFSTADGTSGALKTGSAADDAVEIIRVNRDDGTLTVDGNSTTLAGAAANDYVFVAGDFGGKLHGLDSWIPGTAPGGSDSFLDVNRGVDPVRLAGVRFNGAGMSIEQAIMAGAARVRRWKKGASINLAVLDPIRWNQLEISLENRKTIDDIPGTGPAAHIGYKAIMLATSNGVVPVISDPNCQPNACWLLKKESWMLESTGDLVRLLEEDGLPFLRQGNADGYELRIKSRGNLWCDEPGSNARIALA